jgi:hypothetical protein
VSWPVAVVAARFILAIVALQTGKATYYRDGLMDEVAEQRGMKLSGYAGGVALNDCAALGTAVYLEWGPGEVTGPHLSVDCAAAGDLAERERLGRVVEVDADLAREIGFYGVGPRWVGVWLTPPPQRWRAN